MEDSILDLKEIVILLNNKIKKYEVNIIPTLEHNIDVLVENENRLNNIIDELEKFILKKLEAYKTDKDYFIDEKTMEDLYEELKKLKGE